MPLIEDTSYEAPFLIANRHLGTLVPNLLRFPRGVKYERERLSLSDGDFVDLDWSVTGSDRMILFSHGLEGSARSPYVLGMVRYFNKQGWDALAWNFRSCSGEPNLKPHFYHPGQTQDVQEILLHAKEKYGYKTIVLIGFSLGGVYTLRYLGERADEVPEEVRKAICFSVPTNLADSAKHLSTGRNQFYGRTFVNKYKKKMLQKEKLWPGTQNLELWDGVKTIVEFDKTFNTPWYGFSDVNDFYQVSCAGPVIHRIQVPTLIVNAENDPFLPPSCYPVREAEANKQVFLEIPPAGGHVGFMTFKWKGIFWSESRAAAFLEDL